MQLLMTVTITKISRLGDIPTAFIQFVGIVDPKVVFFRLRKSQKKYRKTCVSNLEVAPAQTCDPCDNRNMYFFYT